MKIRLSVAVFLALSLMSVTSAVAVAVALTVNLDRGFHEYLVAHDRDRLNELVDRLVADGEKAGSDDVTLQELMPGPKRSLEDIEQFYKDLARVTGMTQRPPISFDKRVVALDENGNRVFGPRPPPARVIESKGLLPPKDVIVNGRKIGTIVLVPIRGTPQRVNEDFLVSQYRSGGGIVLLLLFFSLVASWFIAGKAADVVRGVKLATGDIVSGEYRKRAPDSSIREVSEITGDINMLAQELQRLGDLRRKWLAETSHELRTPLAAMTAEVDALVEGVREYSPGAIESLQEEAGNLGRLVDDLHFLAVADLSVQSCHFKKVDPVELCRTMAERVKLRAEGVGLDVEFRTGIKNPVDAYWDRGRINQVLSNLFTNSLRYTDAPGKILLTMSETSDAITIEIEDTPPGVEAEDRTQLFEPLFRVDDTRDRATGGTGLGLSVAKAIVEMHRGTISADASDLGGLRLMLTLPKRPDQR